MSDLTRTPHQAALERLLGEILEGVRAIDTRLASLEDDVDTIESRLEAMHADATRRSAP